MHARCKAGELPNSCLFAEAANQLISQHLLLVEEDGNPPLPRPPRLSIGMLPKVRQV